MDFTGDKVSRFVDCAKVLEVVDFEKVFGLYPMVSNSDAGHWPSSCIGAVLLDANGETKGWYCSGSGSDGVVLIWAIGAPNGVVDA